MMKQIRTFKAALLWAALAAFLMITGCGGGSDSAPTSTNVVVQMIDAGLSPYQVDQMTVSIQKSGGPVLTGVTNSSGIATIAVTSTGTYNVIKVDGVDATALAQGSEAGREFKKDNPLMNPYPYLTFAYSFYPAANVTSLGHDYNVSAYVPLINKVTVLKVGSVTSDTAGNSSVTAGTAAFTGRVMISNINSSDNRMGLRIASSDANGNSQMLYMNITAGHPTPEITDTAFYGGPAYTYTHTGFVNSYTQAGPIYFEASGTDSSDWALGYNLSATDLKTRNDFGGTSAIINFPGFNGGASNFVLRTWSTSGSGTPTYIFDYRIFKFDEY
jgi:hypothetical protein